MLPLRLLKMTELGSDDFLFLFFFPSVWLVVPYWTGMLTEDPAIQAALN